MDIRNGNIGERPFKRIELEPVADPAAEPEPAITEPVAVPAAEPVPA